MRNITSLLLILLLVGCDETGPRACTEIGCFSGYALEFNADDSLSIGDYVITLGRVDQEDVTCSFTLAQVREACTSMDCIENRSCGPFQFDGQPYAGSIFYALPDEEVHLLFPPYQEELTITINQDGETIANRIIEPRYETTQPNGPGCDPICMNAGDEITVNRR